jgi:hypothetical protein
VYTEGREGSRRKEERERGIEGGKEWFSDL